MKKLLLLLIIPIFANGQMGRQKEIELSGGIEENGFYGKLAYGYYTSKGGLIRIGVNGHVETITDETANNQELDVQLVYGTLEYYQRVYSSYSNNWSIYLGGGGIAGYEQIPKEFFQDGAKINAESKTIYGATAGVEIDRYITPLSMFRHADLNVFLSAKINYLKDSDVGEIQPTLGGGLKIYF